MKLPIGQNFTVIGYLESKTYPNPFIKTVWAISDEKDSPHFVTAYPF